MTHGTDTGDDPEPTISTAYRLVDLEPPTLRRSDVEARSGVASEQALRWWRAMGFAEVGDDEVAFRPEDVEIVRRLGELIESGTIQDRNVLRLARLMGASFSRLVDAQLDALDDLVGSDLVELADADFNVFEFMETTMLYVWRRHLLAAVSHRLSLEKSDAGHAVGFLDLSGFSRVSKRAGSAELTDIIDTFEAAAFDVVSAHGGRVVKLIGDEVMFVTDDVDTAVAIGLDLITRLAPIDKMPPVHGGLAFGPTVTIGGDVFGPTVNLASRLTTVARPGSLALPRGVAPHLLERDDLDVRRVRRSYDLKGIGRTSILAIRPLRSHAEKAPA
jgi:adenylate cyclase